MSICPREEPRKLHSNYPADHCLQPHSHKHKTPSPSSLPADKDWNPLWKHMCPHFWDSWVQLHSQILEYQLSLPGLPYLDQVGLLLLSRQSSLKLASKKIHIHLTNLSTVMDSLNLAQLLCQPMPWPCVPLFSMTSDLESFQVQASSCSSISPA